ncbi:MAG: hypothetical protein ABIJ96_00520 [Elusimicrobiota bacterium]
MAKILSGSAVLAGAVLCLSACSDKDVEIYRIAKTAEAPPAAEALPAGHPPMDGGAQMPDGHPPLGAGGGAAAMPGAAPVSGGLRWKLPAGWTEKAGAGMRAATFLVGEGESQLEASVISLGGIGGGMLPNVNRWRRQIGLPPIDEEALKRDTLKLVSPAGPVLMFDIPGPKQRILAGSIRDGEATWFIKMWGPKDPIGNAKKDFRRLLESLHWNK